MLSWQKIRTELGQISYSSRQRSSIKKIYSQITAIRKIKFFSKLPSYSLKHEDIWAVSVVKNELDILPLTINHLFNQGVDKILIADNMSEDGTWEYLQEKAANDNRVFIARDTNPIHAQSEKITFLSHLAWQRGAKWIIPFDADEFWFARRESLKQCLSKTESSVLYAGFHHTVPCEESPEDLMNVELVMDTAYSFPGKVAFRSHAFAVVFPGNHNVARLGNRSKELEIIHVQYRGIEQIIRKVTQGVESSRLTGEDLDWFAPHWLAGSKLSREEIVSVWKNISSGKADERIDFKATGPIKKGKFLQWEKWDPLGNIFLNEGRNDE